MFEKIRKKWENFKNWFDRDHSYTLEIEIPIEFIIFLIVSVILFFLIF